MIDYNETLVQQLSTIVPTYYELFCDSNTPKPCITYTVSNDYATHEGDTVRYSKLNYIVKVWGSGVGEIQGYAAQVDDKMKRLGFKRTSGRDLTVGQQICKIFNYEGTVHEDFDPIGG